MDNLLNEARGRPPLPSIPVVSYPIDFPLSGWAAKCGMEIDSDGETVLLGGFALRATREDAEFVAKCELAERMLALRDVHELVAGPAPRHFAAAAHWTGAGLSPVNDQGIPADEVFLDDTGSVGLGFGHSRRQAADHAIGEALERALIGAAWYTGRVRFRQESDSTDSAGVRTRVLGLATVPLVVVLKTAECTPGVFTGAAVRHRFDHAITAATWESALLMSDAVKGHDMRLQSAVSHDRVVRCRTDQARVDAERVLEQRVEPGPVHPARDSTRSEELIPAALQLLGPDAELVVTPILDEPGVHLVRASLRGAPTLAELRVLHARTFPHDPIA